jgi:predicted Zn-dependent peptidase
MKLEVNEEKLKSGLTLVTAPMEADSVTVMFLVRAGSRDELPGQFGAAHFLEHFCFKGTKKYPKVNDVTKAVDRLGGKQNAFTWTDFTGFWVKLASSHLETAAEVVAQLVCEPTFPDKELKKEQGTIIEEIHMGEDHLPIRAWREFEELLWPESPLGRPILGTESSIKSMKTSDLKAFWSSWYHPENAVVIAAGGLPELDKVRQLVEQKFAPLGKEKKTGQRQNYRQVFTQDSPRVKVDYKASEQAHLVMGVRTFGADDPRLEPLWVLSTILGGNMSSRLWNEIREKRGLAYYIRSGFDARVDQGSFTVRAGVRINQAEEAVKVIKEELLKVAEGGVNDEELEMGKEAVKGNLKLDWEDSMEVAETLADNWASMTGKTETPAETLAKIDKVTRETVKQVAGDILKHPQFNLSLVGPFKSTTPFERSLA